MNAIRMHERSGPGALVFEDVPMPRMKKGDVLIRVHACAITPTEFTWNSTFTDRDGRDRLPVIPSFEVSGTVEKLSEGVSGFSEGDAIYGLMDFWRDGTAAEYSSVQASNLALKPKSLDHVDAAAVPLSGLTAWQGLFDHAKLSRGNKVLIHGAAGGVGTFAVQLAHWCGAYIIGTASHKVKPIS